MTKYVFDLVFYIVEFFPCLKTVLGECRLTHTVIHKSSVDLKQQNGNY